jgi:adenylate cyclase
LSCAEERLRGHQVTTFEIAPAGVGAPAPAPQARRLRRAIRQEHKGGLWLALRLRLAVVAVVACFGLLNFDYDWRMLFTLATLAAVGLVGWVQFRIAGTRFDHPAIMALLPVADVLILVLTLFVASEVEGDMPRIMLDETRDFSWFLLLLTLQALAYRPWLAAWSGIVTAATWIGVLAWMLAYPGTHSTMTFRGVPPDADRVAVVLSAFYDPLFIDAQTWLREAIIALLCGLILAVAVQRSQDMMGRALQAERGRANLSRHFSPSMVDQLAERDQPFGRTRKQEVGVLFADMVGFTSFAENSSPDELIKLLREFHSRVARTIFDHGGTLDKFIGDCVMATFGTPNPSRDDATRTIACCRAISAAVEDWNRERATSRLPPVKVGIGAHYGPVVVGDIGDERRLEFAVLGDTVNVASRLEALTRDLSSTILISDELVQAAQAETGTTNSLLGEFSRTEPQRLRNRAEPVALWAWPRALLTDGALTSTYLEVLNRSLAGPLSAASDRG